MSIIVACKLYFRCRRIILFMQTKQVSSIVDTKTAENHGEDRDLTWYIHQFKPGTTKKKKMK